MAEKYKMLSAARRLGAHLTPAQEEFAARYSQKRIESYMDRGTGECLFKDRRVAGAMTEAIQFWHGKRYRLIAWCVMPNHIHVICRFLPGYGLSEVVRSWKGYSSHEANRILGRHGQM